MIYGLSTATKQSSYAPTPGFIGSGRPVVGVCIWVYSKQAGPCVCALAGETCLTAGWVAPRRAEGRRNVLRSTYYETAHLV